QELLLRTDPEMSKHRGLSWVICDMKAPVMTVRPILSIDGEYHNCEVFYDNVRIPLKNVVGRVGEGLSVPLSTLSFERGTSFTQHQIELAGDIDHLITLAGERKGR